MKAVDVHFAVSAALWLAMGVVPYGIGWLVAFIRFFLLQALNGPISYVTLAMAWTSFLTILWRRRDLGKRAVVVAGCAPFGGAGLYELTQDVVGLLHGWRYDPVGLADLGAWVLVGLTGVYYWNRSRSTLILPASFFLGFLLWSSIGFPQITWADPTVGYLFNVPLKVLAFLVFLVPMVKRKP